MVARVRGNRRGGTPGAADSPAHRLVAAVERRTAPRDEAVVVVYRAGAVVGDPAVRGRLVDTRVVVVVDLPPELADGDLVAVVARRSRDGFEADGSERFLVSRAARLHDGNGQITAYALLLNADTSMSVTDEAVSPAGLAALAVDDGGTRSGAGERSALDDVHRLRWQDLPIDDLPPLEGNIWRTIARALGFG